MLSTPAQETSVVPYGYYMLVLSTPPTSIQLYVSSLQPDLTQWADNTLPLQAAPIF